ncbi:MAG: SDR family oxidoreductase [Rhodobacteraceae bacterium]|nr:SDR family oxidoreductase [Paracoccaceae bacterium]
MQRCQCPKVLAGLLGRGAEVAKRVLITAGASGIGYAMGAAFADAGAEVWVTDIDAGAVENLPEGWRGTCVNVADEPGMAALFDQISGVWGGLDVLCANAGIAGPTARIEDVALADWRTCVSVNLEGAFLAAKYAAPMMKAAGKGAMILTSSTAGIHGYPNRAPYAAAKWAVIGLMKTLAMELGPYGVRANVICPGAVEGPRMEGVLEREAAAKEMTRDQVYEGYASGTSMRSFVEARDIAHMAVFLGSDGARLVSGQVIAVDGHTENPDPKV